MLQPKLLWLFRISLMCLCLLGVSFSSEAAPKKSSQKVSSAKETITYVVKKGDSVEKIAKSNDVQADDIAR